MDCELLDARKRRRVLMGIKVRWIMKDALSLMNIFNHAELTQTKINRLIFDRKFEDLATNVASLAQTMAREDMDKTQKGEN